MYIKVVKMVLKSQKFGLGKFAVIVTVILACSKIVYKGHMLKSLMLSLVLDQQKYC